MPDTTWLNGQFTDAASAKLSAFDAGIQHGIGLFETLTGTNGAVVHLDEHLARLERSANDLRLTERLRTGPLGEAVQLAFEKSEFDKARIRLTITGGDLNMLQAARSSGGSKPGAPSGGDPTILIHVTPATPYPDEMFDKGITVTVADTKANPLDPFAGHKTLNYWWRLRELQQAATRGAGEGLVLQVTNHVAGGCVSNILLVKGETLITPVARGEESGGNAIPSPVLPGVTRAFILGKAEETGLTIEKRLVTVDDVLDADEVMLTNSSWGVLPVVKVESREIGNGSVGGATKGFLRAWRGVVGADT